jgi:N-acyl homoserine lactone hydrolase
VKTYVISVIAAIATVTLAAGGAQNAAKPSAGVERMHVFNCGEIAIKDISHWSPGVNAGQAFEFSNNCYLIRHAKGLMLWDSGYADAVAARPDGVVAPSGLNVGRLPRTLASQLAEIAVTPSQITHLAFSHTHNDHIGNARLFGGDHDVFGDGSVRIVSTPGHTPGHQSLFVRLPRRGPIVLSGDLVHFHDNWNHRRVPAFNYNREQSVASMVKVADLLASHRAELWINHDKAQSARLPRSPQYVE